MDVTSSKPEATEGKETPSQQGTSPELTALQATLAGLSRQMETLQTAFNALSADRQARHGRGEPVKEIPRLTDEEINQAYAEGKLPDMLRRLQRETTEDIVRTHVAPLQAVGVESITNLTREITKPHLKHYDRFKEHIDRYIASMSPEARLNPEAHKIAYYAVIGQNFDVLLAEEKEKVLRQAAEGSGPGATSMPSGRTGRTGDAQGKTPTVGELFGQEAADALKFRGQTEDQFARSLGYKSWDEYVQLYNKQEEAMKGGAHA